MEVLSPGEDGGVMTSLLVEIIKINVGGWLAGWLALSVIIEQLCGPSCKLRTCQIFSKAKDFKMERVWQ